jgi:hypothetical protein
LAEVVIIADADENDLGRRRGFCRRLGRGSAMGLDPGSRLGAGAVVDRDRVPGFGEMPRHGGSHDAETDERNLHRLLLLAAPTMYSIWARSSYRILSCGDQEAVEAPPACLVWGKEHPARDGARHVGRAVEERAEPAGFAMQKLARRVVPRVKPMVERDMRIAARERQIFMSGTAQIEDRPDDFRAGADLAGKLPVPGP